jgi:hypothetical protein
MGTGAFTSAQANRSVSVTTASDSSAQLALDSSGSTNNSYVSTTGGQVSINADDLNVDGTTQINDLFHVRNNGTQPVVVYVNPDSIPNNVRTTSDGFGIDPQATERPNGDYVNTSGVSGGVEDDQISLTGLFSDPPYDYSSYGDDQTDRREEFVLESGQEFEFGLYVNTNSNNSLSQDIEMEIVADATVVPSKFPLSEE